jgi:hypothetical protein
VKFKFTGDFASLAKFQRKVERTPSALVTVSEQLAEETVDLARECIEKSTDPYGKAYAPLVLRDGNPLEDTGGMKAAFFRVRADGHGFTVGNSKAYFKYHQRGTGIYGPRGQRIEPKKAKFLRLGKTGKVARSVRGAPIRRMFPERGLLPAAWAERYRDTAQEVLTEIFR